MITEPWGGRNDGWRLGGGGGGSRSFSRPHPLQGPHDGDSEGLTEGGGGGASKGKGPQRRPQRRLEGVVKAVWGRYCRLQMSLRLAVGVRGTVAGHRLGS